MTAVTERQQRAYIGAVAAEARDRKSTRLNSSHLVISYAVFCLKKKKKNNNDNESLIAEIRTPLLNASQSVIDLTPSRLRRLRSMRYPMSLFHENKLHDLSVCW